MKLAQLFAIYPQYKMGNDPLSEVVDLCNDSNKVSKGSVFIAIKGGKYDGHEYLKDACLKGAIGLVVESEAHIPMEYKGAVVRVENSRMALNMLSDRLFGSPSEKMFCVGITGTNGKTSLTYLIESILTQYGWLTGVMGTVDHHLGATKWKSEMTTPDPLNLQKRLTEFLSLKAKAVAMEVSSHALDQRRADSVSFDCAVFTNLTRDHLDYHNTMEAYLIAKERLFTEVLANSKKKLKYAIINNDDEYGKNLQVNEASIRWTYGRGESDFNFNIIQSDYDGMIIRIGHANGYCEIKVNLIGIHNAYNVVAAFAVGIAAGASEQTCKEALESFLGIPGRMEKIHNIKNKNVFVDYAHTDDALKSVLETLVQIRSLSKNPEVRIICLFGCGGDRDRGKRPLMMKQALKNADYVFVTSDNPRTEDPNSIIKDILSETDHSLVNKKVFVQVDRKKSIQEALNFCNPEDVLLIAGKGHEDYQIIGKEKVYFSDKEIAENWELKK